MTRPEHSSTLCVPEEAGWGGGGRRPGPRPLTVWLRLHIRNLFFFFQAEDGIRDYKVTGVQTCALPILIASSFSPAAASTLPISPKSSAPPALTNSIPASAPPSPTVNPPKQPSPPPSANLDRKSVV